MSREEAITELERSEGVSEPSSEGTSSDSSEGMATSEDMVEINGEPIKVSDLNQWKEYYAKRDAHIPKSEYTRKTQELARERESLKEAQELHSYFSRLRENNPQLLDEVSKLIQQGEAQVQGVSPEMLTLNQRISQYETELKSQRAELADFRLERGLQQIKGNQKYGEFFGDSENELRFLEWAAGKQALNNITDAADEYYGYITKMRANGKMKSEEEIKKRISDQTKKGIRPSQGSRGMPAEESKLSPKDRRARVLEFLRMGEES